MLLTKSYRRSIKTLASPGVGYRAADVFKSFRHTFILFCILLIIFSGSVSRVEGWPLWDSIWFSFTTMTTVGYGDISPTTFHGQLITIFLGYLPGITMLLAVIEAAVSIRKYIHEKQRTGRWKYMGMKNHIVLANDLSGDNDIEFYVELINNFKNSDATQHTKIAIITDSFSDGVPEKLQIPNVAVYSGSAQDDEVLDRVNIDEAQHVVCFLRDKDLEDLSPESYNFSLIHKIREKNSRVKIVAEVASDKARQRLSLAGADACIRPIRAYPAMVSRAVISTGSEKIMENLFSSHGDELVCYPISVRDKPWWELVCNLVRTNKGTLIAYGDASGEVHVNPDSHDRPDIHALFILVKDDRYVSSKDLQDCLAV